MLEPLRRGARRRLCVLLLALLWSLPGCEAWAAAGHVLVYRAGEAALVASHVAALRAGGYRPVPLTSLAAAYIGDRPLGEKAFAVVVTEADRSVLTRLWPGLKRQAVPLTVMIAPGSMEPGRGDLLPWADIRALSADGVTIGLAFRSRAEKTPVFAAMAAAVEQALAQLTWQPALALLAPGPAGSEGHDAAARLGFLAAIGPRIGPLSAEEDPLDLPSLPIAAGFRDLAALTTALRRRPVAVRAVARPAGPNRITATFAITDPGIDMANIRCRSTARRAPVMTLFGRRLTLRHDFDPREGPAGGAVHDLCTVALGSGETALFGLSLPAWIRW